MHLSPEDAVPGVLRLVSSLPCQNESLANFGANVKKQPGFQKGQIQCWATESKHAGRNPASTVWVVSELCCGHFE